MRHYVNARNMSTFQAFIEPVDSNKLHMVFKLKHFNWPTKCTVPYTLTSSMRCNGYYDGITFYHFIAKIPMQIFAIQI